MKHFYFLVLILFFSSCSYKEQVSLKTDEVLIEKEEIVEDLALIPQDPSYFATEVHSSYIGDIDIFVEKYFRAWEIDKISIDQDEATWAYMYDNNRSYTYTLQPIEESFFKTIKENSNMGKFATLNQKGLSLKLLNMRALPTDRPIFLDPAIAGEGYPFDYLQNTSLAPNKPVLISHYSKDREWVFIECSFGFGWVKADDIVLIKPQYTQVWKGAKQVFFTKDGKPIYDQNGNYLYDSRLGMVLPLIQEGEKSYTVLTVSKSKEGKAVYLRSKISKKIAHKGVLAFNNNNIANLLKELQKGNYGWGGIYAQRDCSSTLRDFYTPFGLWLPRNSSVQGSIGDVLELKHLSNEEKIQRIKEKAIPFKTFVYKRGHIALYVGNYNDQPIIFQNVWGVKTKKGEREGRFLIAQPIFSTLEVGKNLREFDARASMLSQMKSINTIVK